MTATRDRDRALIRFDDLPVNLNYNSFRLQLMERQQLSDGKITLNGLFCAVTEYLHLKKVTV